VRTRVNDYLPSDILLFATKVTAMESFIIIIVTLLTIVTHQLNKCAGK